MKAKRKVSSASLVIFCLLLIAVSSAAQTSSKPRKKTNEVVRTNSFVERDRKVVADLDTQYQAAVKNNDVATMDRILADDFVLVTGKGKVFGKEDLLKEAREAKTTYEHQEDSQQTVRVWGDTAVVTALLWVKGTEGGKSLEYKLWFSDVYKRTPNGWRYVFAQAAQPLAKEP